MDYLTRIGVFLSHPAAIKTGVVVVGIAVVFLLRRLVRDAVVRRVQDNTARYRARKLVEMGSYVLAGLFLTVVFSDRLGGLTVAFGVAGAGIAFALQEVIASVAGWYAVTFGHLYKVGDRIMLSGIKGDVIDIGLLRTTMFELGGWVTGDLYNGRVVRIGNSAVFKDPVFNYSSDFPFLWDEITIPIRHGSDRAATKAILQEVAEVEVGDYAREVASTWEKMTQNYVLEKARLEPLVTMTMDENWMTYTLRYVVEFKRRRITADALYNGILARIEGSEGRVQVGAAGQEITLMT